MRAWFHSLTQREQVILVVGGALCLVLLVYALLWLPVSRDAERLQSLVAEDRETLLWMQRAALEVEQLRRGAQRPATDRRPLLTLVEQTARAAGLAEAVNRVEPQGTNEAGVWLEEAGFDELVMWVDRLSRDQSVQLESIVVDPREESGRVNARLVVSR